MRVNRFASFCATAAATALLASAAHAAVVVATDNQSGPSPLTPTYTPSATDLINGLTPSAQAGNFKQENAAGTPVLTNGVTGVVSRTPADVTGDATATAAAQAVRYASFATGGNTGGTSVTYTLPAATTLTSIVVYGGWQDNGRDQQAYTIQTSTNGTDFTDLATANFNPTIAATTPSATRVTFTDSTGTLATGVTAVRFNFNATENGYSGYSEIDVFGSAAVPEPASLSLLALGVLPLLRRTRRR